MAAGNRRMLPHSRAVIRTLNGKYLTFPDSGKLLQGVLHAASDNNKHPEISLTDDVPYGIRGLLKEFEYLGVGICCSGNIIQQFSSSHKLVLAIFGTLELHEFLFPVIVRHQTLRDEVSMSS